MNFPDELTPAIYTFAEKNYKMFITDLFADDEYYDLKQFMLYLFNNHDENFMTAMIHLITCILTKEIDSETNEVKDLLNSIITRISDSNVNKFNESHKMDTLAKLNILKKNYQTAIDSNIGEQIINCHSFSQVILNDGGMYRLGFESNREKLEKKLNHILTKGITSDDSEDIVQEVVEIDEPAELEDTNSDDNF